MKIVRRTIRFLEGLSSWNIRTKLFASYAVILLAAIIFLGSYSYIQARDRITYNLEGAMNLVLESTCSDIEKKINSCTSAMMSVRYNRYIHNILEKGYDRSMRVWPEINDIFNPTMGDLVSNNADIEQLTIYTVYDVPEQGLYLLDEDRIQNESWYKTSRATPNLHWYCEDDSFFAVWEMRNIWQGLGKEHIGTLYLKIENDVFPKSITTTSGEQFMFRLLDDEGEIVYPASKEGEYKKVSDSSAKIDGKYYIYRKQKIGGMPWSLAVYAPRSALYSGLNKIFMLMLVMIVVCLALLGIPGVALSFAVSNGISKLSSAMEQVGEGNLDVKIDVHQKDEIGIIAREMEKMLARLRDTVEKLYKVTIDKQRQELKTLQAQVNPHFLYNALSVIQWTAMEEEADGAVYLVEQLSDFYRTSLNSGEEMTTFENEFKNAKAYINMELIVHENTFEVEYDIDETVYDYLTLNFILQPIIENAIFHGVMKKENGDLGRILITARVEEDIIVTISDNGPGISGEMKDAVFSEKERKGYGLYNINRRIGLMFGEGYGLEMQGDGDGACVVLILPRIGQTDDI